MHSVSSVFVWYFPGMQSKQAVVLGFDVVAHDLILKELPRDRVKPVEGSTLTLFHLFVGESWNDVLYAGINTGDTIWAIVYFGSFVFLVTLLFTNLLIGVICSGYETISAAPRDLTLRTALFCFRLALGLPNA